MLDKIKSKIEELGFSCREVTENLLGERVGTMISFVNPDRNNLNNVDFEALEFLKQYLLQQFKEVKFNIEPITNYNDLVISVFFV